MVYPTSSQDSSRNAGDLIRANLQPLQGQVSAGAPVQTTSVRIDTPPQVQQAPMNPMQAFFASLPQQQMQPVYQPQPMQPVYQQGYQPGPLTQQIAANLNRPVTNTGEWLAANERAWQLEQERRAMNANLAPALNQSFYDATRAEANRRLQTVDPNSISAQIYSAVANNASQMMVPGASFQLPSGDQALSYLDQIARQGGQVSPALRQMAADSDYLARTVGRDGLYESGSLSNWMSNPIGYKSMGIEGRTPFKTYQDIDSPESLAYGGDGSQMAQQLQSDALRDFRWNQDAINRYNQSMANSNPAGRFIGGGPNVVNTGVSGRIINASPSQSQGPREAKYMTNNDIIDEIYRSAGSIGDIPSQFPDFNRDTLLSALNVVRGNGTKADYEKLSMPGLQPQEDIYNPLAGVIDKPGQYESWVPPTSGYDESKMYGPPGQSLPVLAPMAGYATAPKIYSRPAQQAVPKVKNVANSSGGFGGTLSPGWLDTDTTYGPLFVRNYKERNIRPADKLDASGFLQGILDARLLGIK